MARVEVPVDLNRIETKLLFNLTKRQLLCFPLAAVGGFLGYFFLKDVATLLGVIGLIIGAGPVFIIGLYKWNGYYPAEKMFQLYMRWKGRAKYRPYRTNNFYEYLRREYRFRQEARKIIKSSQNAQKAAKRERAKERSRR